MNEYKSHDEVIGSTNKSTPRKEIFLICESCGRKLL